MANDSRNPYEYRAVEEESQPAPKRPVAPPSRLFWLQLGAGGFACVVAGAFLALVTIGPGDRTELAGGPRVPSMFVAMGIFSFVLFAFYSFLLIVGWDQYLKRIRR